MNLKIFQSLFFVSTLIFAFDSQSSTARVGDVVNVFTSLNFVKINVGSFQPALDSKSYWLYRAGKCFYRPVLVEEDRLSCQRTRFVYNEGFNYQCVMVMDAMPGEYIRGCNLARTQN